MLKSQVGKRTICAHGQHAQYLIDSERLIKFLALVTAVQYEMREVIMLYRQYFLHYRLVREALTMTATVGAALLFSYVILQGRF